MGPKSLSRQIFSTDDATNISGIYSCVIGLAELALFHRNQAMGCSITGDFPEETG